jgi:hypothetical protein
MVAIESGRMEVEVEVASYLEPRASSLGPKFPTRTPNFPGYAEHSITAISPTAGPPL